MAISTAKESCTLVLIPQAAQRRRLRRALGPDLDGYGFILPAAIVMVALIVYPFCLALWFSLSDGLIGEPVTGLVWRIFAGF